MVTGGVLCAIVTPILLLVAPTSGAESLMVRPELEETIRARGLDPSTLVYPETLNDEIVSWAAERIDENRPPDRLLAELLEVLSAPDGLGLLYDPAFTATAEEVFATRRANCLAFTHLFVGLSRHYGLETYYLNFEEAEKFRREKDLILVSGHVTAGFGDGAQRMILDFGAIEGADADSARRISDVTALALFYSNRSAEALQVADVSGALDLAGVAVKLAPDVADAWVNLGVARRRSSDLDGAESAYREAVRIDPDHLPAYHNLTALFWLQGDQKASGEIMRILDRSDNRNPFTYLDLGDLNLEGGRLSEARRFYRRALWLDESLGEPKAALGILALEKGRPGRARSWLRRAAKLDPEGERTLDLAKRLAAEMDEATGGA